jgi:N-acetylglucosamine kinase-like BadF-type ATPase
MPLVLGIDGGNSKTEVWLVNADGELVGTARGGTTSHQQVGLERGIALLEELIRSAAHAGGVSPDDSRPLATQGVFCLAGADFPSDVRSLTRAIEGLGVAANVTVLNDAFAGLRAGASRPWGVALVCGHGVNGAAVAPDGRMTRFDAVGDIAGDWGGGTSVGYAALGAAVRGRDGRSPRTSLERLVPAFFGVATPPALVKALYFKPQLQARLDELAPLTFEAATAGDAVARGIIDQLADELVAMARALIRRLRLTRTDVEVVLTGGIFKATDAAFYGRLEEGIRETAPRATLVRLTAPPVLGAALLALDAIESPERDRAAAERRLREALKPASKPR